MEPNPSAAPAPRGPARPDKGISHPCYRGDIVAIFAFDQVGRPIIEGQAVIDSPVSRPHFYRVCFLGEQSTRIRFVPPAWQVEPTRQLMLLQEFWQAGQVPLLFSDFFPTDLSE